jgi:predicted O-linked N-acetylglucosamine transferase (SPINDLY family)
MIEALLEQADRLAAGGQPEKARDLYAQICQLAPHQARYWLRLAELQYELEQFGNGLQALEYALRLEPRNPTALLLASATLLETGGYAQAAQLAERVQNLEGGNRLAALLNQGMALLRLERFAEALTAVDAALALDENQPVAHSTRGSALFGLGRHEEALAAFDQTLALRPEHATALINRAAVLRAMRRPAEALADIDTVLANHPESPAALLNRAAALLDLEQPREALAALDRLLAGQPHHAKALLNRTLALLQLGRYPEALTTIHTLRSAGQPVVGVLLTATGILLRQNRMVQALAWIDQGLAWHPDHPELLRGRIAVLLAQERYRSALAAAERLLAVAKPDQVAERLAVAAAFNANGRFRETLAVLEPLPPAAQDDWQFHAKRGEALAILERSAEACVAFATADRLDARAFRTSYHDGPFHFRPADSLPPPVTPELIRVNFEFRRLEHGDWQDYDNRVAAIQQLTEASLARGDRSPLLPFRALFLPLSSALRLAIACREAEWIAETVAKSAATGGRGSAVAVAQEPARLRIGYVSADFREHPTAHLMRSLFRAHDRRRFEIYTYSLRGDDGSAYYRQIRDDSDQFVDLSGMENAAAVRRIQADEVDILVDLMAYTNFARPEIFALRPAPIQVNWLGFPGSSGAGYMDYLLADPVALPRDQAAFCTEQPVWLPECYQVNDRWQDIAETGIRRADHGLPDQGFVFCSFNQIQKLEPVMFAVWMRILERLPGSLLWLHTHSEETPERLPKARHLERHRLADLFLDTRIYNAHTTASDALWAGVPVLTCIGEAFPARVAASLLQAIGLPELITHSLEEYEALAVRLATQPVELAGLRAKLADHRLRMPLFDTERFARHLERAYELMWERHVQGLPPTPLQVPPLPASRA